jgi:subtilisin family serine protease
MDADQEKSGKAWRRLGPLIATLLAVAAALTTTAGNAGAKQTTLPDRSVLEASSTPGAGSSEDAVPGELLVRFDPGLSAGARSDVRRRARADFERQLPLKGLQVVTLEPGDSIAAARARFERQPGVLYAEPNLYRQVARIPNDPFFDRLWGLHNSGQSVQGSLGTPDADIDAPEAWELVANSAGAPVAIVDTGVDAAHSDLAPNLWTNPGESGGGKESNGIDDDLNGYTDDFRGWDWVDSDNDAGDLNGHGTHVAGTVGARGDNGSGVAGVSLEASLMALRVLDEQGTGTVADLVQAYMYAGRNGARVVNASFGSAGFSLVEQETIQSLPQVLFVAAAGNRGTNNDTAPQYPCSYSLDNIICVAASNQDDGLAGFSNHGSASVDLAAPGTKVLSTWLNGGFAFADGTSMAAPHVSGVAALVSARSPSASVQSVKGAILQGVDAKPALAGRTATGGRLNAERALSGASQPSPSPSPLAPPAPPPGQRSGSGSAARDTTPPRVSLRIASRQKLRRVLRRGLRLRVVCFEPCELRAEAVLRSIQRRTRRAVRSARALLVGRSSARMATAGRKVLVVKLRKRVKKRLRAARKATLSLRVTASDPAGNALTVKRKVRLKRRT